MPASSWIPVAVCDTSLPATTRPTLSLYMSLIPTISRSGPPEAGLDTVFCVIVALLVCRRPMPQRSPVTMIRQLLTVTLLATTSIGTVVEMPLSTAPTPSTVTQPRLS